MYPERPNQMAKQSLAHIVAKPLETLLEYTGTTEDFTTVRSLFELFVRYHFPVSLSHYVNN